MEKPVWIKGPGTALFGIFHPAENNSKRAGVLMLNSGLQYRAGPHRIYVKTALRLSQAGFPVLRMDFPGIGDSEGELRDIHFDCFDVKDTLRAVDFLIREEKIEKVVLLGLCGGARNALKAASRDQRVDSVVLWSLPIMYAAPNSPTARSAARPMSRAAAGYHLRGWMKKALSAKAWMKAISLHREMLLKEVILGMVADRRAENGGQTEFDRAFNDLVSTGKPAFFAYGEMDVLLRREFEALLDGFAPAENVKYHVIPGGDHTFSSLEAEKDVIERTVSWLDKQYFQERRNLKGDLHVSF